MYINTCERCGKLEGYDDNYDIEDGCDCGTSELGAMDSDEYYRMQCKARQLGIKLPLGITLDNYIETLQ